MKCNTLPLDSLEFRRFGQPYGLWKPETHLPHRGEAWLRLCVASVVNIDANRQETFPATLPTARERRAPCLCFHTGAKAKLAFPRAFGRLISAFHRAKLSNLKSAKGNRQRRFVNKRAIFTWRAGGGGDPLDLFDRPRSKTAIEYGSASSRQTRNFPRPARCVFGSRPLPK